MQYFHINPERLTRLLYPQTLWFLAITTLALAILSIFVRLRATLPLDLRVTKFFQLWDHRVATLLARWLTFLANSKTLIVLAIGVAAVCWYAQELRAAFFVLFSLFALPANLLLKNIFDRERPGEKEVVVHPGPRWGFSYPSGHAMAGAAFYGFLGTIVYLHVHDSAVKWALITPMAILPILIAGSRIYLGAHWFSDVVGGLAAGMMLVVILAVVYPV